MHINDTFLLRLTAALLLSGATLCSPPSADGSNSESDADPIAQIRADYGRIMQGRAESLEFQCPTEPFAGTFAKRQDGDLLWLRYTGGHEHGALGLEVLSRTREIVFIMQTESSWSFDPDPEAVGTTAGHDEPTIDTEIQERYYFQKGEPLKALFKKAEARSAANEKIETKIAATQNIPHRNPKYIEAKAYATGLIESEQAGEITTKWCGQY